MAELINFNDGWRFEGGDMVRLPHNAVELPFAYFDETSYQRAFMYEKRFEADKAWDSQEVSLCFEGAMANSVVHLNGKEIIRHADGYTPFEARLTGKLKAGENIVTVQIDGSENPEIPPFGGQIDYLTYAGIYRDVWLKILNPVSIANVKIETPNVLADKKSVSLVIEISNPQSLAIAGGLHAILKDAAGNIIAKANAHVADDRVSLSIGSLVNITLWDIRSPALYTLETQLVTPQGKDTVTTRFGFREARFTPEGFKLNGKPLKIRGLNRHQSFPYVGYALGNAAQIRDAEILKRELKVNLVRTSHYPQSKAFLDRCDELGLLVFEEIPGWQHIGGDKWKARAIENVRAMIERDWNHPSIIIWGVRINESQDDHDFYAATNNMARSLDTTRQTGGVRYITESELLEDVYTMNDFILGNEELGGNRPRTALRPQLEVTGLKQAVPYIITEFGGHMYPTKSTDQEQRQAEHVTRHLEVLNAAYGDPQIAGAIGWCAFDYNTHKDFGSGDRICHHGVMDMFREPKFAAFAYASQAEPDEGVVLKPVTFWARGERNISGVLPLIVLTNCDEIELTYGSNAPKRFRPDQERYPHLPHPPVVLERHHFTPSELGRWGMSWESGVVRGYIKGAQVAVVRLCADPVPTKLEVAPDAVTMQLHDEMRVLVRVLDQVGNKLPFLSDPISVLVEGGARLIGPALVPLRAGSTGFWIKAMGVDKVKITVRTQRLAPVQAMIEVRQ